MRLTKLEKARKVVTTVVVAALVAGFCYGVSSLVVEHTLGGSGFQLTGGEDFSITSAVYATYTSGACTGASTAKLTTGSSQCLAVTVHDPLSVAMTVTALSMTVTSFTPTSSNHDSPTCTKTTLVPPALFTSNFSVTANSTKAVDKAFGLKTSGVTQGNCENGKFSFSFSGSAQYTDTTTTTLSTSLSGTTAVLKATVTPANSSYITYGPGSSSAPVHHVAFYLCGTSSNCTSETTHTVSLTTSTKTGTATYTATTLTPGTHYFKAVYPSTGANLGTFAGSNSTIKSVTVSSSSSSPTTTTTTAPPTTPPPPPATAKDVDTGSSSSPTGKTGTVVSNNPTTHVTATVNATGVGAVTVSQLTSTPTPPPATITVGALVDVRVSAGSSFTSLTEKVCGPKVGTAITWYDTTTKTWVTLKATPAPTLSTSTPPCVSFSLSADSSPTISQLGGTAFAVGASLAPPAPPVVRISGETADATAAQELAHQFTTTHGQCPGSGSVVLSRDNYYTDALASQYLAASLTAGTLLTPTDSLSAATKAAIEDEGIGHVYIVGGSLAISTAVANAIRSLPVDTCGGKTETGSTVQVTRVSGETQYATAQKVATFVSSSFVGHGDFAGAYGGTNSSGGKGAFNDTAGTASTAAPQGSPATAILATGVGFQDSESASVISYDEHFPILLTTPDSLSEAASTAIKTLGITQVIVMGGQYAISNAVVSQLQGLGVSVLRVAGIDYTDTSAEAASFELSAKGLQWKPVSQVVVARGDYFSDGLAGAVVAAGGGKSNTHDPEPVLLTENPTTVGQYLKEFLESAGRTTGIATDGEKVAELAILGGTLALTTSTVAAMQADLGVSSSHQRKAAHRSRKSH
ncbi:MAG: cell wall-binding repeat-containing protein [Acidimicrobiales bacterium]